MILFYLNLFKHNFSNFLCHIPLILPLNVIDLPANWTLKGHCMAHFPQQFLVHECHAHSTTLLLFYFLHITFFQCIIFLFCSKSESQLSFHVCVPFVWRSVHFLVRVFPFFVLSVLWYFPFHIDLFIFSDNMSLR